MCVSVCGCECMCVCLSECVYVCLSAVSVCESPILYKHSSSDSPTLY